MSQEERTRKEKEIVSRELPPSHVKIISLGWKKNIKKRKRYELQN